MSNTKENILGVGYIAFYIHEVKKTGSNMIEMSFYSDLNVSPDTLILEFRYKDMERYIGAGRAYTSYKSVNVSKHNDLYSVSFSIDTLLEDFTFETNTKQTIWIVVLHQNVDYHLLHRESEKVNLNEPFNHLCHYAFKYNRKKELILDLLRNKIPVKIDVLEHHPEHILFTLLTNDKLKEKCQIIVRKRIYQDSGALTNGYIIIPEIGKNTFKLQFEDFKQITLDDENIVYDFLALVNVDGIQANELLVVNSKDTIKNLPTATFDKFNFKVYVNNKSTLSLKINKRYVNFLIKAIKKINDHCAAIYFKVPNEKLTNPALKVKRYQKLMSLIQQMIILSMPRCQYIVTGVRGV